MELRDLGQEHVVLGEGCVGTNGKCVCQTGVCGHMSGTWITETWPLVRNGWSLVRNMDEATWPVVRAVWLHIVARLCGHASLQMVSRISDPGPRGGAGSGSHGFGWDGITLSPLALLMARRGRSTRSTRRIFTTEMALELRRGQSSGHGPGLALALGRMG